MTAAIADNTSSLAPPARKQPVMEDRKRPLNDATTDDNPPSKRQAMASTDEPQTQEDVVNFQKEAIYRQMKAYKREKELSEIRLEELQKRCTFHDDHLRVIDAWWDQLLDEIRVLVDSDLLDTKAQQNGESHDRLPESLLFADNEAFSEHLERKHASIKNALTSLFKRFGNRDELAQDRVPKLQKRISELLSAEKTSRVELQRITQEKDDAEQQLTMAAIRYLQSEKRLDRLKSQTVAKIEHQANNASSSNDNAKQEVGSSKAKFTDGQVADAELARKEAEAIASRQEKEIKQLQAENSRLQEQCTNFNLKLGRLTEEDVSNSETYKNARLRLEDVIAKLNHIEALNNTLSRENETLQAERTAFRKTVTDEQSIALGEANNQISKCEGDLARIRVFRDQLLAELHMHKATADKQPPTDRTNELRKLVDSQLQKIASLEGEVQRLRLEASKDPLPENEEVANMSKEDLVDQMTKLRVSNSILESEFKSIEEAWKSAHDVSKAKFDELKTLQDTVLKMRQDKINNERKVFEAGKAKELAMDKARSFQSQHERSSEIIMNLKNADKKQTALIANLEKQVSEYKTSSEKSVTAQKSLQNKILELQNKTESLQAQIASLQSSIKDFNQKTMDESNKRRAAENELEKTLVRLNTLEQSVKALNRLDNEDSTLDTLRSMVRCNVCRVGMKARAIKQCGHLFCKDCVEERITSRNRKCPNCARPFAATDVINIVL